eukprot:4399325-Prymnesium_polylepis.1
MANAFTLTGTNSKEIRKFGNSFILAGTQEGMVPHQDKPVRIPPPSGRWLVLRYVCACAMLAVCSEGRVLHTSSHPTPHKHRPPLRSS